jgi:hypothetical protein
MRKVSFVIAVVALAVPVAAWADGSPTPGAIANQTCKQQQVAMGAATFNQAYGTNASKSNAFGKCLAKNTAASQQIVSNANQTCKQLQAQSDTAFAAAHGGKTFDQLYGTNTAKGKGAGSNAFGKCVSALASQAASTQATAAVKAAASCKADRKANSTLFAATYGKGRDAFGKCVAAKSK